MLSKHAFSELIDILLLVYCFTKIVEAENFTYFPVSIKLTGSVLPNSGRIDVRKKNPDGNFSRWGTICDNNFGNQEAKVVCHQLGYRFGKPENGVYRDHHSLFILDEVSCDGTETDLSECSHSPWNTHHCVSSKDYYAGVCCSNESSFGEYIYGSYRSHCQMTWSESVKTCSQNGSHISNVSVKDLKATNTTFWSNQIYTPWIGYIGCFKASTSLIQTGKIAPQSGAGICVQLCGGRNGLQFGMSGSVCFCSNNASLHRVEAKHCLLQCQDNADHACGDGGEHVSLYTIVPENFFIQYSHPTLKRQCALLENTRKVGKKQLISKNCGEKHNYICEHYTPGLPSLYIAPGGNRTDMKTSKRECYALSNSSSIAGFDAINDEKLHLNNPSWVDISRYRTARIEPLDSENNFNPQFCVVTSMDSNGTETTAVEDCKTKHLFSCSEVSEQNGTDKSLKDNTTWIMKELRIPSNTFTDTPNSTLLVTSKSRLDTDSLALILIISVSSLILLTLCSASVWICLRRRRKQTSKPQAYLGSQQTGSENLPYRKTMEEEPYTNTYDMIRDSHEYTEITHNKETEMGPNTMNIQENNSKSYAANCQSSGNIRNVQTGNTTEDCFELNENYMVPIDSIIPRKSKLKNVISSQSYTYPYDSLNKVPDHRKTKSAV